MLSDYLQTVDWSRAQFAMTAIYTAVRPPHAGIKHHLRDHGNHLLPHGRSLLETHGEILDAPVRYQFRHRRSHGPHPQFEFGTNWSNYSHFVGDIFGAPLAIEGILAFFLESTFVAVMFFGWNRVSRGFHLSRHLAHGRRRNLSGLWILVANSWMQYPVAAPSTSTPSATR